MSLSATSKEVLLQNLFYSPNTQFTSIKALHAAVKNKGITYNEARDFIQRQESTQLFKKPERIKHYFPIVAKHKYEILQMDLIDMSNMATANRNYNYMLVAVDVFSRFAFVIPLKNKRTETVIQAVEEICDKTEPEMINADLGSEFISHALKKLMKERGTQMNYVDVGDHKKLGIVDRFVRTLREKLNKYMAMHNTTNYVEVLQKIVFNYNNAYHSGIKKIPAEVKGEDEDVIKITNKKYNLAKLEEVKFHVGEKVRCVINLRAFEKKSLPKWSKTIHSVVEVFPHSYKLDNDKVYKYYELQKIEAVQKLDKPSVGPTRDHMSKERSIKRKFRQTGLDEADIINTVRKRVQINRLQVK